MSHDAIVWMRRDLRLNDNPSITAAASADARLFPVACATGPRPDTVSDRWRCASLERLAADLARRGSGLVLLPGEASQALVDAVERTGAEAVFCQREWTPEGLAEEHAAADALARKGIELVVSEGQLLVRPDSLLTSQGKPYRVFTPFYRAWRRAWESRLGEEPPPRWADATELPDFGRQVISDGLYAHQAGEAQALARLERFCRDRLRDYEATRDFPAEHGTSELSPHLAWGEVSIERVVRRALDEEDAGAEPFIRQLAWRDFAYHVVYHFPQSLNEPLRPQFSNFPWHDDEPSLRAWQEGRCGYRLVDAGMRELAATGLMHNRVRLVCASFLVKDLLIPWQTGASWFEAKLADFDPAVNAFNWQWVAGSGADAAPYFRIFNPELQAKRFDTNGEYQRRWVQDDVEPIIDHDEARRRALAAFQSVKR